MNKDAQIPMARCAKCDHDLIAKGKNGRVYCTNRDCVFYVKKWHPTGSMTNEGREYGREPG